MINLHVLFADDEADIREVIAISLRQDAFFVGRACASGEEALATAIEWRPDLILLDINMPGLNGPGVLKRLRANRRMAAITVVLTTAGAVAGEYPSLKALGAAGLIVKPFDPIELARQIRGFLPLRGALAMREDFLARLYADAGALSDCRRRLSRAAAPSVVARVNEIAHGLAGAAGIYGFAGIGCEAAALSDAAENILAGRAGPIDLDHALDRLLGRISTNDRRNVSPSHLHHDLAARRYSAATA